MAGTARLDHLDGIRAVAIGAVLALHWASWYVPLFHGGSVGVDVFLVLSGFIVTTLLWRSRDAGAPWHRTWGRFLGRRVVRLYPALLGLVVGCVVLYAVLPWAPTTPGEVARRGLVVLGQGSSIRAAGEHGSLWLPGLHPFAQTWSLAVEWYFYALWPVALLLARRSGRPARHLAVAAGALAVAAYAGSFALGTFDFYFGPVARTAELLAGSALALWVVDQAPATGRRARRHDRLALAGLIAIVGYAVLGTDGGTWSYRWVGLPLATGATMLLILAGRSEQARSRRLLAHPWLAAVGRGSYSLYLWHVVPFMVLADAPLPRLALGPLAVTSAVGLSLASHRWLELPLS